MPFSTVTTIWSDHSAEECFGVICRSEREQHRGAAKVDDAAAVEPRAGEADCLLEDR